MADEKISQLANGDPAQSADLVPVDRSGSNFAVTAGSIASLAAGVASATVALSSSDLLNLRATPKTLVAGQVGKTIFPLFYQLIYNFVTTPYSGVTANVFNVFPGTDIALQYDAGVRATGFVDQSSTLMTFSSTTADINQGTFPVGVALSSFQGKALSLGFGRNQGPAPLSVGDGTMTVTVFYIVV